jgi:hypothetical protein
MDTDVHSHAAPPKKGPKETLRVDKLKSGGWKITDTDTSEAWDVKNVDDIKAIPDEVRQRLWKQFGRAVQSSPDPKVQENWVSQCPA